jgi:acetyl esterase/lipase
VSDARGSLHLPAREIPVPTSLSAEAQAVLAMPPLPTPALPVGGDHAAWQAMIDAQDRSIGLMLSERAAAAPVEIVELDLGGLRVFELTPDELAEGDRRVYLDIHGGNFIFGAGATCCAMGVGAAGRNNVRVWAVDYRMPPEHPYPAALDDCLTAYSALLADHEPTQIVVGGASAGANLAAATVLRARDEGLAMPAGVVLMTPASDLTGSSDSLVTNLGLDPLLASTGEPAIALYAGTHDRRDPYLSPVYGDFSLGFPPAILTTGTRDLLLSDTVRLHRALRRGGVDARLHVQEAAGHGGFLGMAPEDAEITAEVRRFVEERLGSS